ncbi:PREDICTED: lachesin-like, partial [Rhagoletis zephyria]|uniref:lachesin-like n=1 Tax=Rhagoletis zephyria TaxID=28612 RepID=UPI0008119F15
LVYDGEVLPLTKVSRNEMGAYLCIATNGVPPSVSKRIILDVEFSPMIWVPNQLVGAPAGTDVTIDCHTEAHPKAIIYWVYNSVMVLPSKKYKTDYTENSYRAHMKLTIRNLQYGDFGNYRCISKNSLGETEGSIRVYESYGLELQHVYSNTTDNGANVIKASKILQDEQEAKILEESDTAVEEEENLHRTI